MQMIFNRVAALLVCLLLASNAVAGLVGNADGTAYDSATGLMWKRCPEGQTWVGGATPCSGPLTPTPYTWAQAMALSSSWAGHVDWRLPNIRELQTIVDRSYVLSAVDMSVFPTLAGPFWSETTHGLGALYADSVNFNHGYVLKWGKSATVQFPPLYALLVRGPPLDPARPDGDYSDSGGADGTVTHQPTGLMWQICAKGQSPTYDVSNVFQGCTGTVQGYAWQAAMAVPALDSTAGHTDWRLPSAEELLSLADYIASTAPSINHRWFSDTPATLWSASVDAGGPQYAWYVDFAVGGYPPYDPTNSTYQKSWLHGLRLVRGGVSNGPFTLTVETPAGHGSGNVTSVPVGIDCGTACLSTFYAGKSVTLTAVPTPLSGSSFGGWTGACTGGNPVCVLTINAPQTATATFLSGNASLVNLAVSAGTLVPAFTSGHFPYTDTVTSDIASVTVTPTTANSGATVTVNGGPVASGTPSGAIGLNVGATPILVVVTAEDGTTTRTYTITVTRPSSNADLANLTLSVGTLAPPFASGILAYSADVIIAGNTITVTPTVADAGATVKVNGAGVISAAPSLPIPLVAGANPILVVVTAQDGTTTKSYDVTVNYSVLIAPPALIGVGSHKAHGGSGVFNLPLAH